MVNSGPGDQISDSKAQALKCHIIWPLLWKCVHVTGANCWTVQGVEMNDNSTELIQSTQTPQTHTLMDPHLLSHVLSLSLFLFLPLFLSQLLACGFSMSTPIKRHLVVKHRLHPIMFPLLLWLNLTGTSAFLEPTHLFSVLWWPRCGHQNARCRGNCWYCEN